MRIFVPKGPYVLDGSSAEEHMFTDYRGLSRLFNQKKDSKAKKDNALCRHLRWLLSRGEDRTAQYMCPQCNAKPVRYFSVLGNTQEGYSIDLAYTCCDENACKKKILNLESKERVPTLLYLQFSAFLAFKNATDQKKFAKLIKAAFDLPQTVNKEIAFDFFSKQ